MTDEDIYAKLHSVFQERFKDPSLQVTAETTAENVDGWDSLVHIRLIISIEKEFGVKFKTSEVSSFENIGDLVGILKSKTR